MCVCVFEIKVVWRFLLRTSHKETKIKSHCEKTNSSIPTNSMHTSSDKTQKKNKKTKMKSHVKNMHPQTNFKKNGKYRAFLTALVVLFLSLLLAIIGISFMVAKNTQVFHRPVFFCSFFFFFVFSKKKNTQKKKLSHNTHKHTHTEIHTNVMCLVCGFVCFAFAFFF